MDSKHRQWGYKQEDLYKATDANQARWDHKQDLYRDIPDDTNSSSVHDQWPAHGNQDQYRDNKHEMQMDSKQFHDQGYKHDVDSGSEPNIEACYDGAASEMASEKTDSPSKKGMFPIDSIVEREFKSPA